VLIEIDGHRVLTDPVFGQRASPFSFAGPKRFHPVPARLAELPPLDAVVLSHDHYDHLCASTIAALARMPAIPIVTSLGVGAHLERLGIQPAAFMSSTGVKRTTFEDCVSSRRRASTSQAAP
jgi:L-ascorbate metabolism protein UlaG (beta-lactamase superfamily)